MTTWAGSRREDGLMVMVRPDGEGWIILPRDDSPAVTECPCCGTRLLSRSHARLAADARFPLQDDRP